MVLKKNYKNKIECINEERGDKLITNTRLTMEVFSIYHLLSSGIKTLLHYKCFKKLSLEKASHWHFQNMALQYPAHSLATEYHTTYCRH